MDRHTKATYKRGALIVLPVLFFVGCRVGLRACGALATSSSRHSNLDEPNEKQTEERRRADEAAAAAAAEHSEAMQRERTRLVPTAAPGSRIVPIASGQQVPDSLAVDAQNIAWLATRSGEVVVAPRSGGAPRVVAKGQKLIQRRHSQGLALGGGYVYWISGTEDEGAVLRLSLTADAAEPEVVTSAFGASAIHVDKDSVYYARSLSVTNDDGPTGGVYRIKLGPKSKPGKPELVVAAEEPCAIATDEKNVYFAEPLKLSRAPKTRGAAKVLVTSRQRLGCTVALDEENVYWTVPSDDSLMRARKTDGTGVGVAAFTRTRPTNVAIDQGYAYVLTETSPQALGALGSVFRVALRSDDVSPSALVTDQIGLGSVAASSGFVVFAAFNESESDGTVVGIRRD